MGKRHQRQNQRQLFLEENENYGLILAQRKQLPQHQVPGRKPRQHIKMFLRLLTRQTHRSLCWHFLPPILLWRLGPNLNPRSWVHIRVRLTVRMHIRTQRQDSELPLEDQWQVTRDGSTSKCCCFGYFVCGSLLYQGQMGRWELFSPWGQEQHSCQLD